MLHGKSDAAIDDEASSSCKENKSALQDTLQEGVRVVPKRCFQCECNKSKRAKRKKEFTPILEAMVGKKCVTVRVTPEPALEAVVRGANVMCYVSLKK